MDLESRGFEIVREVLGPEPIQILKSELSTGANAGKRGIEGYSGIPPWWENTPMNKCQRRRRTQKSSLHVMPATLC